MHFLLQFCIAMPPYLPQLCVPHLVHGVQYSSCWSAVPILLHRCTQVQFPTSQLRRDRINDISLVRCQCETADRCNTVASRIEEIVTFFFDGLRLVT